MLVGKLVLTSNLQRIKKMKMVKQYCDFCGNETTNQRNTSNRVYEYRIMFTGPLGEIKGHMIDMCEECSESVVRTFVRLKGKEVEWKNLSSCHGH